MKKQPKNTWEIIGSRRKNEKNDSQHKKTKSNKKCGKKLCKHTTKKYNLFVKAEIKI